MPNNKKNSHSGLKKGLTLAGFAAAAAAGAFYFYGSKEAQKHRKQAKAWSLKARAEVMEKLESLKKISKPAYEKVIQEVTTKYKNAKQAAPGELQKLERELKGYWKKIEKEAGKSKTKSRPKTKRKTK